MMILKASFLERFLSTLLILCLAANDFTLMEVVKLMSQKLVYEILKELGGIATMKEIKIRAKEKFPEASLYAYVGLRLRALEKWGYVTRITGKGETKWKIAAEYRD